MNKAEFIRELERRLKYIPKDDRTDAVEYYAELLSDMEVDDTEDVTERIGSAKDAAKKILNECTQKHIDEYEENKTVKGHATVVWLSILGVLSLPLSVPLAIVVFAIAFSLFVVFISLVIAFVAAGIALVAGGIASLVFMWMAPGFGQKMVMLGMGLCSLATGVLMGFGVFYLVRALIGKIFRRNGIRSKENE
ncbi:MAG: DUF1700 domain-containing protein [Lachnospiraceae bacterium]|nr:DUF1700 domain-containing protein [Lachnospiraceae bacterium]